MKQKFLLLLFFMGWSNLIFSQFITVDGYLKDMEGVYLFEKSIPTGNGENINNLNYNLVHNRINFKAYPGKNLSVALEIRNRIFSGKLVEILPSYATVIARDEGWVDMSWNLIEEDKWFMNSTIDRIYFDYMLGNWQLRAGRQRINWGINLVWNPNDIFNAFSYMDFDYEERPGSDAVLLTWYPGLSSSFDIAYKAADSVYHRAFAAKYRFNKFNYDFQLIAGKAGYDYVFGGGWTGNIGSVGFRGEASYFIPLHEFENKSEKGFSATVSFDYNFPNSIYLHASALYNSLGTTEKGESFSLIDPTMQLSAKKLSIGKYELFGQISYPIGSLLNISAAAMVNPLDLSMYLGPGISVSLHDNWELYLTSQIMLGDEGTEFAAMGNMYSMFGRLRWSF